ncbi:MAG TPA: alpha/beta hydrolase [Polyangiaceae bacterium]|nr:alpha/beta hydrolase [Polyangiaceae bacterium]
MRLRSLSPAFVAAALLNLAGCGKATRAGGGDEPLGATDRAGSPRVIALWPDGAPGSEARRGEPELARDYWVRNVHDPSVTVFAPPAGKANGTAIVIAPGGGHRELVFDAEGVDPARYLAGLGVTAFALKYRLAREEGSPYDLEKHTAADIRRAMRLVRSRAAEWKIDPARIGVMGWSAGGEVAAMVAYRPVPGDPRSPDPVERVSARPDFQIIVYPGPYGIPDDVPPDAPPAFFLAANDDEGPSANIIALLQKYRRAGVPAEAHLYAEGHHAFNMGRRSTLVSIKTWPQRMADWLTDRGLLSPRRGAE